MYYLIRHAPTVCNENKIIYGITDSPVTPRGQQLAKKVGAYLAEVGEFESAHFSHASRTSESFGCMGLRAKVIKHHAELGEGHKGDWENVPEEGKMDEIKRGLGDPHWRFPGEGGESCQMIGDRMERKLLEIHAQVVAKGLQDKNHAIVSSFGPIRFGLGRLLKLKTHAEYFGVVVANCGVYRYELDEKGALNALEHLDVKTGAWNQGLYPLDPNDVWSAGIGNAGKVNGSNGNLAR